MSLICPECGSERIHALSLAQHRAKKHGVKGRGSRLRDAVRAVVGWWDVLDSRDPEDEEGVVFATREMNKRINALREALEL
jgi:hypothetical protein